MNISRAIKHQLKKMLFELKINPQKFRLRSERDDESWVIYQLFKNRRSGVLLDVGFAWGSFSTPYLLLGWDVYGFEPDLSDTKLAAIKTLQESFPRALRISEQAVSDVSGDEVSFFVSEESEGISSLHPFKDHQYSRKVVTTTLDKVINDNDLQSVTILKIDTEGHDLSVLKSLSMKTHKPDGILVEFDENKTRSMGHDYRDLGNHLSQLGYFVIMFEWFPIVSYGGRHKMRAIKKFPSDLSDENAWGNFLAVKPELAADLVTIILGSSLQGLASSLSDGDE